MLTFLKIITYSVYSLISFTNVTQQVILPRKFRTITNNIPPYAKPMPNGVAPSSISLSSSHSTSSSSSTASSDDDQPKPQPSLTPSDGDAVSNGTAAHNQPAVQGLLLTRQALHTYQSNNHLVHYKYSTYGRSHHELPR